MEAGLVFHPCPPIHPRGPRLANSCRIAYGRGHGECAFANTNEFGGGYPKTGVANHSYDVDCTTLWVTPPVALQHFPFPAALPCLRVLSSRLPLKRGAIALHVDECTPFHVEREYTESSMHRTHRWALRSLREFIDHDDGSQAVRPWFAILVVAQGAELSKDVPCEAYLHVCRRETAGCLFFPACRPSGGRRKTSQALIFRKKISRRGVSWLPCDIDKFSYKWDTECRLSLGWPSPVILRNQAFSFDPFTLEIYEPLMPSSAYLRLTSPARRLRRRPLGL